MERRRLGALEVSGIGLGCATMTPFYGQPDPASGIATIRRAKELGIDFLDTADVYPLGGDLGTVGRTEEILGGWLDGKRHGFVIATKGFGRAGPLPWDQGMSRKHILLAIEASLRRLRTDYVDIYF